MRKEEICVLRLVFPIGKSIKMLFKLDLDFGKNRKFFLVYILLKGETIQTFLLLKAELIRHKLLFFLI